MFILPPRVSQLLIGGLIASVTRVTNQTLDFWYGFGKIAYVPLETLIKGKGMAQSKKQTPLPLPCTYPCQYPQGMAYPCWTLSLTCWQEVRSCLFISLEKYVEMTNMEKQSCKHHWASRTDESGSQTLSSSHACEIGSTQSMHGERPETSQEPRFSRIDSSSE